MILQEYIDAPEPFITRVEIVGGQFVYAMRSDTSTGFELCPSDACQLPADDAGVCPADGSGSKFSASPIQADDPLVLRLIAMCQGEGIDLAGIEFIEDRNGRRYTYDINGTTNYSGVFGKRIGIDGMSVLARHIRTVVVPALGACDAWPDPPSASGASTNGSIGTITPPSGRWRTLGTGHRATTSRTSTLRAALPDPVCPEAPWPSSTSIPYEPAGDHPGHCQLTEGVEAGQPTRFCLAPPAPADLHRGQRDCQYRSATLVLSHNKTLAAQLLESSSSSPTTACSTSFRTTTTTSEAYVASSDTYIQRLRSTSASTSCATPPPGTARAQRRHHRLVGERIYGLGSREAYDGMLVQLQVGDEVPRRTLLRRVDILCSATKPTFTRYLSGPWRRGRDLPTPVQWHPYRDVRRRDRAHQHLRRPARHPPRRPRRVAIYPASHYVTPQEQRSAQSTAFVPSRRPAHGASGARLAARSPAARRAHDVRPRDDRRNRSLQRNRNYSRHLSGRIQGEPPPTLIEYFPEDWLLVVDESHVTLPQVRGMFRGDRARKEVLVRHGFRLPSALDNRPLQFGEFQEHVGQAIYVSATPGNWELEQTQGEVVEQIIRPTGLLDPNVEVRPATDQVDDLLGEIRKTVEQGHRILVTVLTKRMAQELTDYYRELGVKVRYLHSDIDTLERVEIVRDLRLGEFDVLVGINLLREGLDIPEVSLVAVLDADREGFLRNPTSLVQTIGRAARNADGHVLLYADRITDSMAAAMERPLEGAADRVQRSKRHHARDHSQGGRGPLAALLDGERVLAKTDAPPVPVLPGDDKVDPKTVGNTLKKLRREMKEHARRLEFERAAETRDRIRALEAWAVDNGVVV